MRPDGGWRTVIDASCRAGDDTLLPHIGIMRRSPLGSQNAPLQQRRRVVEKVSRRRLPVVLTDRPIDGLQVVQLRGGEG